MFFINEYQHYLVKIHMKEKTLFYDLQPKLHLLIDHIRMKYKVFYDVFDKKLYNGTTLFFYHYFNSILKYKNISSNNHICFDLFIPNTSIYKYNIFYYSYLSYSYDTYNNYFYTQDNMSSPIEVQFKTLLSFSSTDLFYEISSVNSLLHVSFKSTILKNGFFFNKLYLSHFFFNI